MQPALFCSRCSFCARVCVLRKKALNERSGDEERWIAGPRSFMQLTIRRLKRKQKQYLTARKNVGISNNGLNATDRPRKPIGYSDLR